MRIYFCSKCGAKTEVPRNTSKQCECGRVFGGRASKISDHINMRTTWSGTTQVEFGTTTMNESIDKMNRNE